MTSEVLILNKKAIVIGADSAVTTSGGDHPRYSKTADKIFELCNGGSIAAAIYGSASIDGVPWEVALKLFRSHLGAATLSRVGEYSTSLIAYLTANDKLFSPTSRRDAVDSQFDSALKTILEYVRDIEPAVMDDNASPQDRKDAWSRASTIVQNQLASLGVAQSLSQAALDALLNDLDVWTERAQKQLDEVPTLAQVDASLLARLGHMLRYHLPTTILNKTGLVVAGYGDDQIFPAYEQLAIYGHVGEELYHAREESYEVSHAAGGRIKPLAQTSMIDMFTDGFGKSLEEIIDRHCDESLGTVFADLGKAGIAVPKNISDDIIQRCQGAFKIGWKRENWRKNLRPLMAVLQGLSVQEMAHLAESLLGLESLKERVTSPSESVGGPIDVAVITRGEGLVWVRRKHYFDPELNLRYQARLRKSLA